MEVWGGVVRKGRKKRRGLPNNKPGLVERDEQGG